MLGIKHKIIGYTREFHVQLIEPISVDETTRIFEDLTPAVASLITNLVENEYKNCRNSLYEISNIHDLAYRSQHTSHSGALSIEENSAVGVAFYKRMNTVTNGSVKSIAIVDGLFISQLTKAGANCALKKAFNFFLAKGIQHVYVPDFAHIAVEQLESCGLKASDPPKTSGVNFTSLNPEFNPDENSPFYIEYI